MFVHEMHCGAKDEATHDAYSADIRASAAPAPKTDGEVLKEQLKRMEIAESSSGISAGSAGANVAFPLSSQAKAAIAKIKDGSALWMNVFHVSGSQIDSHAQAPPPLADRSALASSAAAFLQAMPRPPRNCHRTLLTTILAVCIRCIARFCSCMRRQRGCVRVLVP